MEIWVLFVEMEQKGASKSTPLEKIPYLSIETKVLLSLEDWVALGLEEMATPSKQSRNLERWVKHRCYP